MTLFNPDSDCNAVQAQTDCEDCVQEQFKALQNVLVGIVQAIQAAIEIQAKTLARIGKAMAKLASDQCKQQTDYIDPAIQALINTLSVQVSEHTVQLALLQQLFTTIQQTVISQQATITQIQNVQQTTGGTTVIGVGPGSPTPVPSPPGIAGGNIPGPVTPVAGPNITIQVTPLISIPPPPPVTVILPPQQTTVNVSTVLPSISNNISNVTQIGPITATATAQGGGVVVNPETINERVETITNNFRETINNWKLPPEGPKPPGMPPRIPPHTDAAGLPAVDPIAFPVSWLIAPDDDAWRDASSQWAGDVLQVVQNAPSFDALVQLLKRQVTYLGA